MISLTNGVAFNSSNFESDPPQTIYDEFRKQLNSGDDSSYGAIIEPPGRSMTYPDFGRMVDNLAKNLQSFLQPSGAPVAVLLPPGAARISALLALNSLRLPFVPLDSVQTQEQHLYILDHSKAQAVITNKHLRYEGLEKLPVIVIDLNCELEHAEKQKVEEKPWQYDSKPCLILYTSGSTGMPKGICLSDSNLLNRLRWQWSEIPFAGDGSDVCLAKTNILFVDSYTEILGAVLRLQNLVIVDLNAWKSDGGNVASMLADAIEKFKATRLILVPSLLTSILDLQEASRKLSSLRFVVSSGEALPLSLARRFFQTLCKSSNQPKLANFYGSTEVTGDVTAAVFCSEADVTARSSDGFVSLGRPVYNTSIYVCSEDLPLPLKHGEIGHVFVSGDNLCLGFAGESNQQIDRFSVKPPEVAGLGFGKRLLGMGDLGKISQDGELFYCGRSDSIVKIRGNRVSTIQVEKALNQVIADIFEKKPPCSAALPPKCKVLAVEHQSSATFRLAAFYESWSEAADCLRPENIRRRLIGTLPVYCIPEVMLSLPFGTFPLQLHTGKIDQIALKKLAQESFKKSSQNASLALANFKIDQSNILASTLQAVRLVVAFILGIEPEKVAMDATFFEQGGNSLTVIAAVVELSKLELPQAHADLLFNQKLSDVALKLATGGANSKEAKDWIEFRKLLELTCEETQHVQKRMGYSFSVLGPIAGKLLRLPSDSYYRPIVGEWKYFVEAGDVSFVALDSRQTVLEKRIVGAVLCTDLTVKNPDLSIWSGLEAISAFSHATEAPVHAELRQQYADEKGQLPFGTVLSYRMLYVESNIDEKDAAAVFLELELELVRRAKQAGYKTIVTKNASPATQILERDVLGFKERHGIFARQLVLADGSRPYAHAPEDYAMVTMTLDL